MDVKKERLYYLDNLKVLLTFFVIIFHINSAYGGAGGWYIVDTSGDEITVSILTLINAILQSFFMGLFFFISGYFSVDTYRKSTFKDFIFKKFKRLLIPALIYFFIINPICINMVKKTEYLKSVGFYNLWFVMALFYFSIAYGLLKKINIWISRNISFFRTREMIVFMLVVSTISFAIRLNFPIDKMVFSDFTLGFFPQYISLFFIGVIFKTNNFINLIDKRISSRWFNVSIISFIFLLCIFYYVTSTTNDISKFYGGFNCESLFFCIWEPCMFIGIIYKLIYIFKENINYSNKLLKNFSRNSYTIYICHGIISLTLEELLYNINLPVIYKVGIVLTLTILISFLVSQEILKIKFLRKIL